MHPRGTLTSDILLRHISTVIYSFQRILRIKEERASYATCGTGYIASRLRYVSEAISHVSPGRICANGTPDSL